MGKPSVSGYNLDMATIEQLQDVIRQLSDVDFQNLRFWMNTFDDDEWDRQMRQDAHAGRLDAMIAEADREIEEGRTKPGP
jgi:hypothetical protein